MCAAQTHAGVNSHTDSDVGEIWLIIFVYIMFVFLLVKRKLGYYRSANCQNCSPPESRKQRRVLKEASKRSHQIDILSVRIAWTF